jgi:hypothetical protein
MQLTEQEPIQYQVTIKGIPYGAPQPSRQLAEQLLFNLSVEQRVLTEIKQVTPTGQELLLG